MVVLITCKNNEIKSKIKALRYKQNFPIISLTKGIFSNAQGQLTQLVCGRIVLNFDLVQGFIVILLTCMNEEDPIKNEGLEC